MSENLFGLTVAADKGLDDLQCQRLLSENRKYQEVMLQYRCALKAEKTMTENQKAEKSVGAHRGRPPKADVAIPDKPKPSNRNKQ